MRRGRRFRYLAGIFAAAALIGCGEEADPQAQADAYIADYLVQEQTLSVSNLTGRDIVELRVSFSEGEIRDREVLEGSTLRDGAGAVFRLPELSELRDAEHLRLSVMVTTSEDERMDFPEIAVWDIASTSIVLTTDGEDARMYLE